MQTIQMTLQTKKNGQKASEDSKTKNVIQAPAYKQEDFKDIEAVKKIKELSKIPEHCNKKNASL